MKCKKCNAEMVYFKDGNSCGWNCPKCGNGFVTSFIDDLQADESIYTIILKGNESETVENLKVISKIASISILEAKKLGSSGGMLFKGKAVDVKDKIILLDQHEINYDVDPEFPYDV